MKSLIDDLALELSHQINYEPTQNEHYTAALAKAEQAKNEIDAIVCNIVSPSLLKWIPIRLRHSKIADFVAQYLGNRKKLDWALNEYTDAVSSMKYFAADHAFEQGLKAGLRLQSELKDWAQN